MEVRNKYLTTEDTESTEDKYNWLDFILCIIAQQFALFLAKLVDGFNPIIGAY